MAKKMTKKPAEVGMRYTIGGCPNCGATEMELDYYAKDKVFAPFCSNCGMWGAPGKTPEEAIELWDENAPYVRTNVVVGYLDDGFPYECLEDNPFYRSDAGYKVFEVKWVDNDGVKHSETTDLPNDANYEVFKEYIDEVDGGSFAAQFELTTEKLCLEDPRYRKDMIQALQDYEIEGYVSNDYEEMVDLKFWEIVDPMLTVAYNMGVGESVSAPFITLTITRVQ